jgi:hypothetical protein
MIQPPTFQHLISIFLVVFIFIIAVLLALFIEKIIKKVGLDK